MIKIFSTDKVRELDRYTIEYEPIDSIDLVERAATAFTGEFCRHFNKQMRVVVFAGQGNNGAEVIGWRVICSILPRGFLRIVSKTGNGCFN